ncbi:MAG: HEAT repeat domain-containing protein [Anaerolineae bacterium]|nr:HEAT repeat domain-containing protein [Anaerolineae bacterium]
MPDLDAFEAQVTENIKQLSAKDPKARREAAAWLGEAGDPTAITALVQAYKNDPDPRVREDARYALGMFRKLEEALGKDQDGTVKLLQDIALHGKIGHRIRIPVRTIAKVIIGLLISAALVAAMAFVLPPLLRGSAPAQTVSPTVEPNQATAAPSSVQLDTLDRPVLTARLQDNLTRLSGNVSKLQAQYQAVLGGGEMNCAEFFDSVQSLQLSEANARDFPELAQAATDLNAALAAYQSARSAYSRVCEGGETIAASEFGGPMGEVIGVIQALAPIQTALTTQAASTDATAAPTTEAAALPADMRTHLQALDGIITAMTAPDSPNALLTRYWTESQDSGGTNGCGSQVNVDQIPADYALPEDMAQQSEDLNLATGMVNTGLALLRQSQQLFATACAGGDPDGSAETGLQLSGAATDAFNSAAALVIRLK